MHMMYKNCLCVVMNFAVNQIERLGQLRERMLIRLTKDLQCNINSVLDLKELVVGEMVADRNVST
jgi:hypothetical protein